MSHKLILQKGFTLAEVLIVFAIIGTVLSLLIPHIGSNVFNINIKPSKGESWCEKYSSAMQIPTEWHKDIGCVAIYIDGTRKIIRKDESLSGYHIPNTALENTNKIDKMDTIKYEPSSYTWE